MRFRDLANRFLVFLPARRRGEGNGDMRGAILERGPHSFQGGEERGQAISRGDILDHLTDALLAERYGKLQQAAKPKEADRTYRQNEAFWTDALSAAHFPGANIILEDFYVTEWLPFAPGRYFAESAPGQRELASKHFAEDRDEYTPEGKASMVRGGIGAIRLGEKPIGSELMYFLGASSNGIAHQGIPIALPNSEYKRVIQAIKDSGGCRARLVGTLRTITDELPKFYYGPSIPRYCFFTEEAKPGKPSRPKELLTTTAIMFGMDKEPNERWNYVPTDDPSLVDKSWTFCSFDPGASKAAQTAASWLYDYATRYSHKDPKILTDFDEHYALFTCRVEFPLKDIVRGKVDWETLRAYNKLEAGTYIQTYIREQTVGTTVEVVMGDKFSDIHNSTIVNRSFVENAFNKVNNQDQEAAKALLEVSKLVAKSGNKEAGELLDQFNEELAKPEPRKSLLKRSWDGLVLLLPTIKEVAGAAAAIAKLFV
jgi:hypothetical protein